MDYVLKDIGYKIIGEGKPLFFIHGGAGMTSNYFEFFAEEFSKRGYMCFLIDQRGNGKSKNFDIGDISIDEIIEDFEKIRLDHNIEKVNLIGHSFGSFIALQYIRKHINSIDKAILLNSIAPTEPYLELMIKSRNKMIEYETMIDENLIPKEVPLGIYKFMKMCYSNKLLFKERIKIIFNNMDCNRLLEINEKLFPEYIASLPLNLSSIQNHILVLHGENDFIPLESSKHLYEELPNSVFKVIPNCGHFTIDENIELTSETIDSFL